MPELLILGGTRFVGRQIAVAAVSAGYRVTLFNRGKTDLGDLTGRVRVVVGDRDPGVGEGLSGLASAVDGGARWDAVVDACGYVPRLVRASAELLRGACDRYVFISTVSVYGDLGVVGLHEGSAVADTAGVEDEEVVDGRTYGPLKVLCERVVSDVFAGRGVVVRPGLIVGPGDYTDRFTFWPARLACRGRVFAPSDSADHPVQVIDVRDLASFVFLLLTTPLGGGSVRVYNAVGESGVGFGVVGEGGASLMDVIESSRRACAHLGRSPAEVVFVEPRVLSEAGILPWQDVPMWLGEGGLMGGGMCGMMRVDGSLGRSVGLVCRGLDETVLDTLSWWLTRRGRLGGADGAGGEKGEGGVGGLAAGLSFEREEALLGRDDAGVVCRD